MTCAKTQGFLARRKIVTGEVVDAKKRFMDLKDALGLLRGVDELISAKGKNVTRVDLRKGKPDRATLERLMIGPTGRLRAPTFRVGRRLIIGFDEATYRQVLG
jgi:arsenate reductase-like glutaredoxin family protein